MSVYEVNILDFDPGAGNEYSGSMYPGNGLYYNGRTGALYVVVTIPPATPTVLQVVMSQIQFASLLQKKPAKLERGADNDERRFSFRECAVMIAITGDAKLIREYFPPDRVV